MTFSQDSTIVMFGMIPKLDNAMPLLCIIHHKQPLMQRINFMDLSILQAIDSLSNLRLIQIALQVLFEPTRFSCMRLIGFTCRN